MYNLKYNVIDFVVKKTVIIFVDMKAKKTTTIDRNNRIRERFTDLDSKNKYKHSYIYDLLAKEFYLSSATIENIIFYRV